MLNRRLLRGKAMQAVYAYERTKEAVYMAAKDRLQLSFEPDYAAAEAPDVPLLKSQLKEAQKLLVKSYDELKIPANTDAPIKVQQAVVLALNYGKVEQQKEKERLGRWLLIETNNFMTSTFNCCCWCPN